MPKSWSLFPDERPAFAGSRTDSGKADFINMRRAVLRDSISAAASVPPDEVIGPLSKWALMYGVPYRYLVPDESMLPPESVRFFKVDYNYIYALLDGAMSLGRSFESDHLHDAAIIENAMDKVYSEAGKIRVRLQRKPEEAVNAAAGEIARDGIGYGFLLRSDLVRGWRGLEFTAFCGTEPLRAAFLETIGGGDVLMGIYTGEITRLVIAQPPEEMHFGCESAGGGFRKKLRGLENGKLYDDLYADIEMRDGDRRVINWAETAGNIRSALSLSGVNSAHIALEMIQNPATGEIIMDRKSK